MAKSKTEQKLTVTTEQEANISRLRKDMGMPEIEGVKKKRKKKGGPNPLSCKKKKNKTVTNRNNNSLKDGGVEKKKRRKKKKVQLSSHLKVKEVLTIVKQNVQVDPS